MSQAFDEIDANASKASGELSGEVGNITQTCPAVTLEIGVFFDGTNNNEMNTAIGGNEGSYANARSNVSLLKSLYKNHPRYYTRNSCGGFARKFDVVYIPGIGTVSGEEDHTFPGSALGMGATGVEARVYYACLEIGNRIRQLSPGIEPEKIIMDVFGFSRGAAAARYFVNCFRQGYIEYHRNYIGFDRAVLPQGRNVEFRFVGIFDTVAAIGIGTNDDNGPVNVHLKTAQAERIFHLTAGNEYRENFRLNKNVPGGGETRELPGAHSDVGGGYRDNGDKVDLAGWRHVRHNYTRSSAESDRSALLRQGPDHDLSAIWIEEGWMYPNETEGGVMFEASSIVLQPGMSGMMGGGMPDQYIFRYKTVLSRPWVRIGLSRIALKIMYDAAVSSGVPLLSAQTGGEWEIPADLQPYARKLFGGGTLEDTEKSYILRNFGHVSASDSIGMAPEDDHIRVEYDNQPSKAK